MISKLFIGASFEIYICDQLTITTDLLKEGKGVWFDSESSMFNALQFSKETSDRCIALTTTIDWQQISSSSSSMSSSSPLSSSSSTTSSALSWCLSSLSVSLAFNCYGLYLIISWTWRQMHCQTVFLWTFHDLEIFTKKYKLKDRLMSFWP